MVIYGPDSRNDKCGIQAADPFAREAELNVTGANIADLLNARRSGGQGDVVASGSQVRIGLVGRGIQQSRSPMMHEQEGKRLGLRYSYELIDFDQLGLPDDALPQVVQAAERVGFAGLNVTHPYKQAVIELVTDLSSEARSIGAVNTVVFAGGARSGHNTDSWGFAESFRTGMSGVAPNAVTLIGAGGAGAAVAYALLELGARDLTIVDSDRDRAERLAARMSGLFDRTVGASDIVADWLSGARGIVNATPVGMAKYPGMPLPEGLLRPDHWIAEIIYFPSETELLRRARALGCRTLSGAGMAVFQAVRAFELFTGITPDRAAMVGHFEAAA